MSRSLDKAPWAPVGAEAYGIPFLPVLTLALDLPEVERLIKDQVIAAADAALRSDYGTELFHQARADTLRQCLAVLPHGMVPSGRSTA